jgi:hypothetical protein
MTQEEEAVYIEAQIAEAAADREDPCALIGWADWMVEKIMIGEEVEQ